MKDIRKIFDNIIPKIEIADDNTYVITAKCPLLILKKIISSVYPNKEAACNALATATKEIESKVMSGMERGDLSIGTVNIMLEMLLDNLVSHIEHYIFAYEDNECDGVYGCLPRKVSLFYNK